jgi:hypothetical protein
MTSDKADRPVDRADVGEGRYANFAEIGHNAYEFVFDFGQVWLDGEPARVYFRVITSPDTAQRLYESLNEALLKYRKSFGTIRVDEQSGGTQP